MLLCKVDGLGEIGVLVTIKHAPYLVVGSPAPLPGVPGFDSLRLYGSLDELQSYRHGNGLIPTCMRSRYWRRHGLGRFPQYEDPQRHTSSSGSRPVFEGRLCGGPLARLWLNSDRRT